MLVNAKSQFYKYRLVFLALGVAVFLASYSIGAALTLSPEDAKTLRDQFSQKAQGIDQSGIFVNNLAIAVGMFIPAAGVGIGAYAGASTGMVFSAYAQVSTTLSDVSPLALLVSPYGVLEVLAYGLAMSRSGMLVLDIVRRRPVRSYLLPLGIEIAIVVVALLTGSIIESQSIRHS